MGSSKPIKPIQQFAFCWLLAGLISHTAQRGLSACSGWVISCADCAAQQVNSLRCTASTTNGVNSNLLTNKVHLT